MIDMRLRHLDLDVSMTIKSKKLKASITVEATFSFTITVFVLFLMLGPLLIIKTSSDILLKLNEMSKTRCNYEMIKYSSKDLSIFEKIESFTTSKGIDEENISNIENALNDFTFYLDINALYDDSHSEYRNVNSIYNIGYNIYDTETHIVKYDYLFDFILPYNVLNIDGVLKRLVSNRRAFVGSDGDRFDAGFEEGEFIYVANNYVNSLVYHLDINCTYLVKKTQSVEYKNVGSHRNYNNQKYSKCDYCFKKIRIDDDTVCYITQYGDKFHYKDNCPLMTAYVTKIPKEHIEGYNLRPCFKCANSEE